MRRRLFECHLLAIVTITADEFSEEGRSADGGLRNGDLLIPQKCEATILPTASYEPENLSPCNFGTTFCWQKVVKRNFNFLNEWRIPIALLCKAGDDVKI